MNDDGFVRMAVTAADYDVVAGVMREHGVDEPGSWPEGFRPPEGAAYLAVFGHTVVGTVAVRRTDAEATMTPILMRPGLAGTGLGWLLGLHAIAAARRIGASRLRLDGDVAADRSGYESLGFVPTDPPSSAEMVLDLAHPPGPGPVGVVAAGGASHRMGEDKTFLEVGGRPMLAWIMAALAGAGVEPVIAGRPSPFDGIASLPDPPDVAGPAAALTAVFRSRPGADVVLGGADQPHLRSETVIRLLDTPGAAVTVVDQHRQTLCTVYRDRCAPVLERLITERPDPPLQVLLDRVETVEITADTYGAWGEDGRSWLSIDDPETLQAVREAWPDRPR
jgi:molybdopterin-guanine dinucleotide biosynthesis protein A/GNAT superfamily N-acetyltransferase